MMRSAAIHIIRALDVQGGCNIQFAFQGGEDPVVIEVTPVFPGHWHWRRKHRLSYRESRRKNRHRPASGRDQEHGDRVHCSVV